MSYNKLAMDKIATIFSKKQSSIGAAAFVLISMVFASRVLGLVRDRLLAARFAPEDLGIYFAAFRLPNLLFELLVMGALTSAFIPVFTKYLTQDKKDDAWKMTSTLINLALAVFFIFMIPIFVWTKQISSFLAPGFSASQIEQMAVFTRYMLLFQVVPLLIGNFFTGILQSYKLFLIPALAPVVYNVGIILGIILLTPVLGLYAPVVGVGVGAFLFMAIQIPLLLKIGYRHKLALYIKDEGVAQVAHLMAPRTLGLAISQVDTTIDLILASLLGARMVTIFNFAQHLQQLPIGLFGATIAQAALPTLSAAAIQKDYEQFKKSLLPAMHQILFFVLPASVLFIVLRIPVVRLVFGASRFDWEATVLTGMTLSTFSVSLFAQAISQLLARGFYALYDTKTPVVIGIVTILINTFLSVIFIQAYHLPIWSLGLSTSIASIANALVLLYILDRKVNKFSRSDLFLPPIKMLLASAVTGIMLFIPLKLLDQLVFDTTRTFGLILLTGFTGSIGLVTYLFLSWVLGVGEAKLFINLVKNLKKPRTVLLEPAGEVVNGGMTDKVS